MIRPFQNFSRPRDVRAVSATGFLVALVDIALAIFGTKGGDYAIL
jgi:hypothetical protein